MNSQDEDIQDCLGMVELSIRELGADSPSILATRDVNVAFHRKVSSWMRERGYITVSKRGCYVTEKYVDLAGLKAALEKKYKVKRTKPLPALSHKFKRRSKSTRTMVGKKQGKPGDDLGDELSYDVNLPESSIILFGEEIPLYEDTLVWDVDHRHLDFM
eukprot:TRINITY_DN8813_c0_g1_i1.p1 TRINITY_DN8813_c0_g1~~TRINITY_DN8813_c0_g1_i1.p1  ORF type:complete len:159 (-),score=19.95 TRINITY_DN8813_c0_g1_i1:102-578(-)